MKKKGKKPIKKSAAFDSKKKEIQNLQNEISFWQKKNQMRITLSNEFKSVLEKISNIQRVYGKHMQSVLNSHSEYQELIKKKKKLKLQIAKIPLQAEINNKIKLVKDSIADLTKLPKKQDAKAVTIQTPIQKPSIIEIEWNNISFGDNFITAVYNGHWFEKFYVQNSKKSLNIIKNHYKFKKSPKLILEIKGRQIIRIQNIEVLFYFILFLRNAGTFFDKNLFTSIVAFKNYTKKFYKNHIPHLFQPRCFSFLCEYSADNLPIIPVPEVVINSNGSSQIHDSFLFPVANHSKIFWIWESIEESKATYIFETRLNSFESNLQIIYDYLTGVTINKRETLIHSPKLKTQLNYDNRKMHTSFKEWTNEIRPYLN